MMAIQMGVGGMCERSRLSLPRKFQMFSFMTTILMLVPPAREASCWSLSFAEENSRGGMLVCRMESSAGEKSGREMFSVLSP